MKPIPYAVLAYALCALASCEELAKVNCKVELQVNDDELKPVAAARVAVRYPVGIKMNPGGGFPTDRHENTSTETDAAGMASLSYYSITSPDGLLWIRKDGYYDTVYQDFKWEKIPGVENKWFYKAEAILKPVKNPIPMHAFSNTGDMRKVAKIPELNKDYGFDLMKAEALPPLGKGEIADFKFRIEGSYQNKHEFDMKLSITFPNPSDGVVEFETPQRMGWREPRMSGSVLISDYVAPESGYVPELTRKTSNSPKAKRIEDSDFHKNHYFRVRTHLSPEGKIISAKYGKIYGDFHFQPANNDWGYSGTLALETVYFNPTPNDRNVEFDPKRNLNPDGSVRQP